MDIGKNAGWILFWMLMASILVSLFYTFFLVTEPRRDAILEQRLAMIENARTVDDLKPLLRAIVSKQRYDYR
jgi:hypothetical protein